MPVEVEVINVTKRFDDIVAVDNVPFEVMKNEFFSLLGPSGCGKTMRARNLETMPSCKRGGKDILEHDACVQLLG